MPAGKRALARVLPNLVLKSLAMFRIGTAVSPEISKALSLMSLQPPVILAVSEAARAGPAGSDAASWRALFNETALQKASRWVLGMAYACHPKRIRQLPHLLLWSAVDMARGGTYVPSSAHLRARPDTFAGVCRDVSPETIMAAARGGFFPWCHIGPLKWWTRENRMVLPAAEFRMSKNLKRIMKRNPYTVTFDTAFDEVIKSCSGQRKNRPYGLTWITPKIMRLYSELHRQGHAHSFEVWSEKGELVGGGYGLSVGRVFFTESQFSIESNTSKMGFATLLYHLSKWGYVLNDGKDWTPSLEEAGFRPVPRPVFEAILKQYAAGNSPDVQWRVETSLSDIARWDPKAGAAPGVMAA